MKRAKPQPKIISRRELAIELGVAPLRITKWQDEGLPIAERGGPGRASRYNLEECRAWRDAREAAAAEAARDRASVGLDPMRARAEKDQWQAALAKQMHDVRARELLPADEVERAWAAELEGARARFLAVPQTYADRIHRASTLKGVRGVEAELRQAVNEVLRELAAPSAEEVAGNGHGKRKRKSKATAKPKARAKRPARRPKRKPSRRA